MTIEETLRRWIATEGIYSTAKGSGVAISIVSRFVRGERGINLTTAQVLADYFGLELRKARKGT